MSDKSRLGSLLDRGVAVGFRLVLLYQVPVPVLLVPYVPYREIGLLRIIGTSHFREMITSIPEGCKKHLPRPLAIARMLS